MHVVNKAKRKQQKLLCRYSKWNARIWLVGTFALLREIIENHYDHKNMATPEFYATTEALPSQASCHEKLKYTKG